MIIRNVDSNNDWVFGKGKNDYKRDSEALVVDLKTRLQSWKYNCFFDKQEGIDYKSFLGRGTKLFLDADIKRVILQTEGVLRINTFSSILGRNDRNLTITANISTIYGEIEDFTVQT